MRVHPQGAQRGRPFMTDARAHGRTALRFARCTTDADDARATRSERARRTVRNGPDAPPDRVDTPTFAWPKGFTHRLTDA